MVIKKTKILKEDAEEQIVENDTAALDSVKPNSHPANDPKSNFSRIADMIGVAAAMKDEHLTKWYDEMIARAKEIGHGPGIPDGAAAKNKSSVEMHKEALAQDIEKILSEDSDLSDDFKKKITVLFETAVESRVNLIEVALREENEATLGEVIEEVADQLIDGVQQYLDFAADEWIDKNEVAIESTLRNEIFEDFISGLRQLFVENNFNIPEEQVEVVDTMAEKVNQLEGMLADAIDENSALTDMVSQYQRDEVVREVADGLTLAETEKLKELAENVDYETVEQLKEKLETIKTSTFVKETKKSSVNESLEEVDPDNAPEQKKVVSPEMKRFVDAISRSVRK